MTKDKDAKLLKTKEEFEEVYGGEMKRYSLPERFVGPSEYTAKLSDQICIETIKVEKQRIGPDKRKVIIEKGSPLHTLDGKEEITEIAEGMEVLAPSLFGWFPGRVRKIDAEWQVEGEDTVALVEWDDKRKCYVSESAYHKAALKELRVKE